MISLSQLILKDRSKRASLLVCLPTPVYIFYLRTYRPRPMQANKKSTLYLFFRHHTCNGQMNWFSGFSITSAFPVLADGSISRIKHCPCWHTGRFLKFSIVVVGKYPDFQNSALSSLADTLISEIQHCWIFTKSTNPGIRHCWLFTEWRFQRNYIASFFDFLHSMSWIRISTLQTDNADFLKPSVLCEIHWFSRGQFDLMIEDRNADFLNVSGLPTPAMLFSWNALACEFS